MRRYNADRQHVFVQLLDLLRQLCPGFEAEPLERTPVAVRAELALHLPRLLLRVFEPAVDPAQLALGPEAHGLGDCVAVEAVAAVDLYRDAAGVSGRALTTARRPS